MGGYLLVGFLSALIAGYAFKWKVVRWLLVNLILVGIFIFAAGNYLSKYFEVDYTSGMGEALVIIIGVAVGNILGAYIRALVDRARKTKEAKEKDETSD